MKLVEFPVFTDPNGVLSVFEAVTTIPFPIRRVFSVTAGRGSKRGEHSHIRCSQLVVCIAGRIRLSCFDGETTEDVVLDGSRIGVLIPPGIWATQEYLEDNSTIIVFCDRVYEAEDYIRDHKEFLRVKAASK
jgi:dTDP-4-dehydrorhamnose 3,5-epimerase-like enzyme